MPLYEPAPETPNQKQERELLASLSKLASLYEFELMDVKEKPYPYNILLAHWDIHRRLNQANQWIELEMVQEGNGGIKIATQQSYDVGNTLYYIPITPLYRLLQQKHNRRTGELLLCVFSYLYRVAGVPYYRDAYSATAYYYDMIEEWVLDDLDCTSEWDMRKRLSQVHAAAYYGDVIFRKLYNPIHLNLFEQRINTYKPKNETENQVLKVAKMAFTLLEKYPTSTIFQNIRRVEEDDDGYENGTVHWEQYISFMADTKGGLYDTLADLVSNEFNECSHMQQPTIIQVFDDTSTEIQSLDFEQRFFALLRELCILLNDLP